MFAFISVSENYFIHINDGNTAWQQNKPALIGALNVSGCRWIYGLGQGSLLRQR